MEYLVGKEDHGLSLLCFLKKKNLAFSAKKIKKTIEEKRCCVNEKTEFFSSRKLFEGDLISFDPLLEEDSFNKEISIFFEDEYFVIVNKPSGLICLDKAFQKALGEKAKNWSLIHRLDKDTSGLILLAKTSEARDLGKTLFHARDIQKIYLVIVEGKMQEKEGVIDNFLGEKGAYQGQTLYGSVPPKSGKRAITFWKRLDANTKASFLQCDIKTGRTHQIRVHFSEKNHPVVGDSQYAKGIFYSKIYPTRHLLHAWKLEFIHPITKTQVLVQVPIPEDFQKALKKLVLHL